MESVRRAQTTDCHSGAARSAEPAIYSHQRCGAWIPDSLAVLGFRNDSAGAGRIRLPLAGAERSFPSLHCGPGQAYISCVESKGRRCIACR